MLVLFLCVFFVDFFFFFFCSFFRFCFIHFFRYIVLRWVILKKKNYFICLPKGILGIFLCSREHGAVGLDRLGGHDGLCDRGVGLVVLLEEGGGGLSDGLDDGLLSDPDVRELEGEGRGGTGEALVRELRDRVACCGKGLELHKTEGLVRVAVLHDNTPLHTAVLLKDLLQVRITDGLRETLHKHTSRRRGKRLLVDNRDVLHCGLCELLL